jgi:hypothetical protein
MKVLYLLVVCCSSFLAKTCHAAEAPPLLPEKGRFTNVVNLVKRSWSEWRESIDRRRKLLEDETFWRELANKWDFDTTQSKLIEEWREWTGEIVSDFHEFQANTKAGIANSISSINEARHQLRQDVENAMLRSKKSDRFTVIHHVDALSFSLTQLHKVLRAQRQVQEAGHRYVVLYWTPRHSSADNSDDGHLLSLQSVLPRGGAGVLYVITPLDLELLSNSGSGSGNTSSEPVPSDYQQQQQQQPWGNYNPQYPHPGGNNNPQGVDCFRHPSSSSSSSSFSNYRRYCADKLAAAWLWGGGDGTETASTAGASAGAGAGATTPHYWLLDISVDWVGGSLPSILARWHERRRESNRKWQLAPFLASCDKEEGEGEGEGEGVLCGSDTLLCHAELQGFTQVGGCAGQHQGDQGPAQG